MEDIKVTGRCSVAFGVNDTPTPTGKCSGPFQLPYDRLSELLGNPINKCIFCKGENICYYGGECSKRI